MASANNSPSLDPVEDDIKSMHIKSGESSEDDALDTVELKSGIKREEESDSENDYPQSRTELGRSRTSAGGFVHGSSLLDGATDNEETVGGEVILKEEPGQPPKLERRGSQKITSRTPQLFIDYEDKTGEATDSFQVIESCTYASKSLGYTEHAMDCDCAEEWDNATSSNLACGEDSDCINRATKMECVGDCGCGADCQNQRFQRKMYADITIIKTEKKGYGVRTNVNLEPNQFIFEYIGEVINERDFRKRMVRYDEEGVVHFYFMSLNKGEFIDATRRGNLGRFCNHSCNPNCYVDKWVVGDKLRMGIFAERRVLAGEELVFNYNVDRYGADAQACYCGEPNCIGVIGGKTQTERASKLPLATLEALGIDDGDGWDTTVAKRPRKKRAGEDDEQWVDSLQPQPLDEDGVTKVMAVLMQCKEKWIAVKLLSRIERCEEASVRNRVIRMHGYQILKTSISNFRDDDNVVFQILTILDSFPRVTRNKIADSKVEDVVATLRDHEDDRISEISGRLMEEWSKLEVAYRIPRIKRDPNAKRIKKEAEDRRRDERRRRSRSKSRSRSPPLDAPRGPSAPTGPKNQFSQRAPFARRFQAPKPLPAGWHTALFEGRPYYYTRTGQTSWVRPTAPAIVPPAGRTVSDRQKRLDDIIGEIVRSNEKKAEDSKTSAASTQVASSRDEKEDRKDKRPKWMSYDEGKQMKLYENTIHPHIKYVVDKYKSKLPKDTLKDNFKTLSKKIVESDFRKKRVADPTKVDEKKQRDIKKFTKEYFDKLLARHREYEKKKAAKLAAKAKAKAEGRPDIASSENATPAQESKDISKEESEDEDDAVMEMFDNEYNKEDVSISITPQTPLDSNMAEGLLKRKRGTVNTDLNGHDELPDTETETSPKKRMRSATPPPPPPPPVEEMPSGEASPVDMIPNDGWGEAGVKGEYDEDNPPPPPLPAATSSFIQNGEDAEYDGDQDPAQGALEPGRSHAVPT